MASKYEVEFKKGDVLECLGGVGGDWDKEYVCVILSSFSAENKISDFNLFESGILDEFEEMMVYRNGAEMIEMVFERNTRFYICLYGDQKVLVESEYPETEHRIVGSIVTN